MMGCEVNYDEQSPSHYKMLGANENTGHHMIKRREQQQQASRIKTN
jgi:hypothetical protein